MFLDELKLLKKSSKLRFVYIVLEKQENEINDNLPVSQVGCFVNLSSNHNICLTLHLWPGSTTILPDLLFMRREVVRLYINIWNLCIRKMHRLNLFYFYRAESQQSKCNSLSSNSMSSNHNPIKSNQINSKSVHIYRAAVVLKKTTDCAKT